MTGYIMFISYISEDWSFFMTTFCSIWTSGCKFTSNRSFSGNIRNLLLSPDFRLTILHFFSNGMYMFFRPLKHPFLSFVLRKRFFPRFYSQYNYYCQYNLFCILCQNIDTLHLLLYNILTTVCFVFL